LRDADPDNWWQIVHPADRARLHATVEVIWERDEPMPLDQVHAAWEDAIAIVSSGWRYRELPSEAAVLRAIIDVSGGFPMTLDYPGCFARGIRVLSAAPAVGPQVAEMALAMALAASREIVAGDRADGHEHQRDAERGRRFGRDDAVRRAGRRGGPAQRDGQEERRLDVLLKAADGGGGPDPVGLLAVGPVGGEPAERPAAVAARLDAGDLALVVLVSPARLDDLILGARVAGPTGVDSVDDSVLL